MNNNVNLSEREAMANSAIENITGILEKYTDHINLLDIIDIVDNLRTLAEIVKAPVAVNTYSVSKKYVLQRKKQRFQAAGQFGVTGRRKASYC